MKDLKNQETGQSSKFEGKEGESVLVLGTHKAGVGSSFVGEEDSSKGKNKKPKSLVSLRSSEGDTFELEESSAMLSQTIKHMIEEDGGDHVISLTNISSEILERVVVFLEKHGEIKERDELVEWDKKFIEDLKKGDLEVLFGLIVAADYLNAKCLLDVTCQVVADMIKGKTPEEIRKFFNIKNVVTPEEEEAAAVRAENAWAFE
ncbi:hypothetical protein MKW94_001315 [Papaver nudicaule]|uniref:SKP1-like protein n=1 Tax=Papaver nudicaule TaxID=74823 RepID=A0AA42AUP7_PAPNU|nr:hypothetical protein [Papaver nudicaule]